MGPLCPDEYGVFLGRQTHTLYFFQSQRNLRKVLNKIRQTDNRISCCYGKTGYIDRASIVFGEKSGDFHSKSGDREIFIILSKIGRSPEKSGDLEALAAATWLGKKDLRPGRGSSSRPPAHRSVNTIKVSYAVTTRPRSGFALTTSRTPQLQTWSKCPKPLTLGPINNITKKANNIRALDG